MSYGRKVAIWDTSAINKLADRSDRNALIVGMKITHEHWIPIDLLVEIAATPTDKRRQQLLEVCRSLHASTGKVPWSASILLKGGINLFANFGQIDWEILLASQEEFERAITDRTLFDDDLAKAQRSETSARLRLGEEFFGQMETLYFRHFQNGTDSANTLDEFIAMCRSRGLIRDTVQSLYSEFLGHSVDIDQADRLAAVFPPVEAVSYAFAIAHYHRNELPQPKKGKPAGILDLMAAAFLPVCQLYVSDDFDQQVILREVVECCQSQTKVIRFEDYAETFAVSLH